MKKLLVVFLCAVASGPALAADVSYCADVGAGLAIDGTLDQEFPVTIDIDRDPTGVDARLDFTGFDPDTDNEINIRFDETATTLTDLDNIDWAGTPDGRSGSWSEDLDTDTVVQGTNTVVFIEKGVGDPFTVQRVCITLLDPPLPVTPAGSQRFCATNVDAPDVSANNGGNAAEINNNTFDATIEVDLPVSGAARVGVDAAIYVRNDDDDSAGTFTLNFDQGVENLQAQFTTVTDAVNGSGDHYVVQTTPATSALLAEGSNTVELTGNVDARYWTVCLVVEDAFPQGDAGPLPDAGYDAGPAPADAGPGPDDGGPGPDDAGNPTGDGGVAPGTDGGPPKVDAGNPFPGTDGGPGPTGDAGTPAGDGGTGPIGGDGGVAPTGDGGTGPRADGGGVPGGDGGDDPDRGAMADDISVGSACACVTPTDRAWPAGAFALLGVVVLLRRRRRPTR